jgi:hypothetical protein
LKARIPIIWVDFQYFQVSCLTLLKSEILQKLLK